MWETLFVAPTAPHLRQVWILIAPIVPPLATLYLRRFVILEMSSRYSKRSQENLDSLINLVGKSCFIQYPPTTKNSNIYWIYWQVVRTNQHEGSIFPSQLGVKVFPLLKKCGSKEKNPKKYLVFVELIQTAMCFVQIGVSPSHPILCPNGNFFGSSRIVHHACKKRPNRNENQGNGIM